MFGAHTDALPAEPAPFERTPAPWLWAVLVLPVGYLAVLLNARQEVEEARAAAGPLMARVWPLLLLAVAGGGTLAIIGRTRQGRVRAYLRYLLLVIAVPLSLANVLLFQTLNGSQPGWRLARKATGSLTEAALASPDNFSKGRGKLCLLLRDYLNGHQLVADSETTFHTTLQPLILGRSAVRISPKRLQLTPQGLPLVKSLRNTTYTSTEGLTYHFVWDGWLQMKPHDVIYHFIANESHYFVPQTIAEELLRKGVLVERQSLPDLLRQAALLADQKRFAEAAALTREVVQMDPLNDYAQYRLGRMLVEARQHPEEAERALMRATALEPEVWIYWLWLGNHYRYQTGDTTRALDAYRRFAQYGGADADVSRWVKVHER